MSITKHASGVDDITTDPVGSLKAECKAAGTNLNEVCKEAGYKRSIVERWKKTPPKTLRIISDLRAVIARKASENQSADA